MFSLAHAKQNVYNYVAIVAPAMGGKSTKSGSCGKSGWKTFREKQEKQAATKIKTAVIQAVAFARPVQYRVRSKCAPALIASRAQPVQAAEASQAVLLAHGSQPAVTQPKRRTRLVAQTRVCVFQYVPERSWCLPMIPETWS